MSFPAAASVPAARVPDISENVAAAVKAIPGVADLHGGAFGQVASYLPGRSVTGVRIRDDVTDVHVVLFWGAPVLATADRVRATVLDLVGGLSARVDVTVEDVIDPTVEDSPLTGLNPVSGAGQVLDPDQVPYVEAVPDGTGFDVTPPGLDPLGTTADTPIVTPSTGVPPVTPDLTGPGMPGPDFIDPDPMDLNFTDPDFTDPE